MENGEVEELFNDIDAKFKRLEQTTEWQPRKKKRKNLRNYLRI